MSSYTHLTTHVRCGWRGPSLLVANPGGWIGEHRLSGYYFRETRHLSRLALEVDGHDPYLCSLSEVQPERVEVTYLWPPVGSRGGGGSGSGASGRKDGVLFRDLDLDLRYRIRPASLEVRLRVTSRWEDAEVALAWALAADFADLIEAEGGTRKQAAEVAEEAHDRGVLFRYRHPDLRFSTRVELAGPGDWSWRDGRLEGHVRLERQQPVELLLTVRPDDPDGGAIDEAGEEARERRLERWYAGLARLEAPGDLPLVRLVRDAMRDVGSMALLDGEEDEWLAPAAGIPLYPALFGRDAFTMAWQATLFDRGEMLDETYNRLAHLQGSRDVPWRDELPGRSIQQSRRGPLGRLGVNPFDRYYADYASPMMFIISLAQMYAWSGRKELLERH